MKTIDIDLPKNNKKVLIGISFPVGYFNESDKKFGIGHLVEHYLVSKIIKEYGCECFGEISDSNVTLFLDLNKKEYKDFKEIDLIEKLKDFSRNIDKKILQNEKKRIEIELEEKYSDSFKELSFTIESSFINTPKVLKRNRLDQIKNIKKFKEKDVSEFINKLSKTEIVLFTGFAGNKSNFENKKIKVNKLKKKPVLNSGEGKLVIKNPVYKKANNFVVCFEGLSAKANMTESVSLSIFARELYNRFNKKVYDFGVYSADYKNLNDNDYGMVWYSVSSYKKMEEDVETILYETINEILEDKDFKSEINKAKEERIKNEKKSWKDGYSRFDWIVNDITEVGHTVILEEAVKKIEKVNKDTVKKVVNKVFKSNDRFILRG